MNSAKQHHHYDFMGACFLTHMQTKPNHPSDMHIYVQCYGVATTFVQPDGSSSTESIVKNVSILSKKQPFDITLSNKTPFLYKSLTTYNMDTIID